MRLAPLLACLAIALPAPAAVVINEIFYHAPNDLADLQWVELHNTGGDPVDLSDWLLQRGLLFRFPKGTTIEPHGFLVVARNPERFAEHYPKAPKPLGPVVRPMSKAAATIELLDAKGQRVDAAHYDDHGLWPASPDGYSSSLERICPTAPGDASENWAASPLPKDEPRPGGTPGRQNSVFSPTLPPIIKSVSATPEDPAPGQALRVQTDVAAKDGLKSVSLLYRVVTNGRLGNEFTIAMTLDSATGQYAATIPAQPVGTLVRYRVKAVAKDNTPRYSPGENDLRPTFSTYVHDKFPTAKIGLAYIIPVHQRGVPELQVQARGQSIVRPPRGGSAVVYVDPKSGKPNVFDHISVVPRDGGRGYIVHFDKDRPLNGMTAVSIIFEGDERFLLAEYMAYDVYRRAGNAAPLADFVRLFVDGQMVGYHLMIEQPNKSFLRRNKLDDSGNLYKLIWTGGDLVGQHEKKTNVTTGHDDLVALVTALRKTRTDPDEQWKVIQQNFNVKNVSTYFAVNMVLSHWDGYFNNYLTYHDPKSGKWEMYPWDQDKTWGYYDGIGRNDVFTDMPLTFGMDGDVPPGGRFGGFFGGGGTSWWRRGGFFSGPLLANPHFRKIFLARTKEILEKVYTPETYTPLLDATADRLREDVALRGESYGRDAAASDRELARIVNSLKRHLTGRREFLLGQKELQNPPTTTTTHPALKSR